MKPSKQTRVMVPLGIGLALSLFGDATLYTVLPQADIAAKAGVSLAVVGALLGINRFVRIFFNGPVGMLLDRLPRRKIMLVSMALGGVSTLLFAIGSGALILMIARVIWGAAWSGIWVGCGTIALDISNEDDRGRINGQLQMAFFIGVAVSSLCGGILTDVFGYRGGLWVSASLSFFAFVLWFFCLPETRITKLIPLSKNGQTERQSNNANFPWRKVSLAGLPMFMMRMIFTGIVASTAILWLEQFLDVLQNDFSLAVPLATLTGAFAAIRVVVSVFSAPVTGWISDRLDRRWGVVAGISLVGAVGMFMMGRPVFIPALVGGLLAAIPGGGIPALVPAYIGDVVGDDHRSRALGVLYTFGDLGGAFGPSLAFAILGQANLSVLYSICAILFGITALFSAGFARFERKVRAA
jgi:MFS family permease